jgi:prephenate dehydrogenase
VTIGLIGYGRFGKFAARRLASRTRLVVHDTRYTTGHRRGDRFRMVSLDEAAGQEVVILAVPVSALRPVLRDIRPHLRPGALVVDVSAVKEGPVRWMKAILPKGIEILGTHPLFGPDSAARSVRGKTVVLCPVRLSRARLRAVERMLSGVGIRTLRLSPKEHDRLMAETIFLTQFLGRLVVGSALRRRSAVTGNYGQLLELVETVRHDTRGLFIDMVAYSGECRRVVAALRRSFAALRKEISPRRR